MVAGTWFRDVGEKDAIVALVEGSGEFGVPLSVVRGWVADMEAIHGVSSDEAI
jgi:hypothetical protein